MKTYYLSSLLAALSALAPLAAQAAPSHDHLMGELWTRAGSSVTSDVETAKAKSYTHVVVGCGLAGLTVAVRLSEDKQNTVLCLEAGGDSRQDDRVVSLRAYGQAFGTELDWHWKTSSSGAGGSKILRGGKTLGGSTAINNGAVTCASASQYDALEQLGNDGWNWDNLGQYFKRFQTWTPPNKAQSDVGARSDASAHGTSGPISVAFSPGFFTGPQQPAFMAGIKEALGLKQVDDLCSGDANAVAYTQNTVEPTGDEIRSSSATGYLTPVENTRPNLVVLTTWRGVKMNWAAGSSGSPRAASVVAQSTKSGPQETFAASSEVIVAAGAIRSPLFLEASGLGEKSALDRIGVEQKVDLPGVGKNLQDQTMSVLGTPKGDYDFGGNGPPAVIAMPSISQIMANATDVEAWVRQNLDAWAEQQVQGGGAASKSGLLKQYNVLTDLIFKQNAPVVELFGDSGFPSGGLGIDHWQLLPLSRGYVHSSDASGFGHPDINPRYFDVPLDMQITVHGLRASRKTLKSNAIKSALGQQEVQPGFNQIPDGPNNGRWSRWQQYVLDNFGPVSHQIGTAAMLPREDGGVVGPDFKVYGTSNVRVVDASVLPVQLSAHLSASLYAFAEKAAATIKGSA